jgi:hypothetical protein
MLSVFRTKATVLGPKCTSLASHKLSLFFIRANSLQTVSRNPKNGFAKLIGAGIGKYLRIADLLNNRFWLADEGWLVEQKVRFFEEAVLPDC